jgi:hypothetical protein
MGNADTGKDEDTSEEDTKNAEKYSLLILGFPLNLFLQLVSQK